jgi:hypothetical protein
VLAGSLIMLLLLAACGTAQTQTGLADAPGSPTPSPTSALPPLFDRPASEPKIATIQAEREAHATWEARGVWPTANPPPLDTPEPAPTPVLGLGGWCLEGDPIYAHGGCWSGGINNEYLFVTSDVERSAPDDSWLRVYTSTQDLRSNGPAQEYSVPGSPGLLYMAQVNWPRMILITMSGTAPVRQFVFNVETRAWEAPGPCPLLPLTVAANAVQGLHAREAVTTTLIPDLGDKIGWLAWNGDQSDAALARSLILPGDGDTYRNPDNPNDHALTTDKWVRGRTLAPAAAARTGLQRLSADHILAVWPVWDQWSVAGADARYHVTGFAWVGFSTAGLTDPNQVTVRYWGRAACPPSQ